MNDDDDEDTDILGTFNACPGTVIRMSYAGFDIDVESATEWTPEMMETALVRVRRQMVAGARQFGLVAVDEANEVE